MREVQKTEQALTPKETGTPCMVSLSGLGSVFSFYRLPLKS